MEKVARSLSIFSRLQLKLVLEDEVQALVEEQEIFLGLVEQQQPPPLQALVVWETSISSATTLNSNNSVKLFSSNLKCSSLSSNKSALVTHNWHN